MSSELTDSGAQPYVRHENDDPCASALRDSSFTEQPPTEATTTASSPATYRLLFALSAVGFLINCQPSEAFLTPYLEFDKKITDADLDAYVWPVDTYAALVALPIVGLLAELIGYRSVIFLGLCCRLATRNILLFGHGVTTMALMQATYAIATSVNTVMFAYVYMVVPLCDFQRATSWVITSYHLGNVLGSGLGQVMVTYGDWHRVALFYLSLGFTCCGVVAFAFLPRPRQKAPLSVASLLLEHGCRDTWYAIKTLYTPTVMRWSTWWIFGFSTYTIVTNYAGNQFVARAPHGPYGVVEVAVEGMSAVGSWMPSMLPSAVSAVAMASAAVITTAKTFDSNLAVIVAGSCAIGGLWFVTTIVRTEAVSYTCNVLAASVYSFQMAMAYARIADSLQSARYALVFTLNTLAALVFGSIVMAVCSARHVHTDGVYLVMAVILWIFVALYIFITLIIDANILWTKSKWYSKQYLPTGA